MDSIICQKSSKLEPYNKQTEAEQPSKYKTLGFVLVIIVGVGGVIGAAFGTVGLASSPAWIVSVIGKEGCLAIVIGGAVIGGVGIGGGVYGLKKKPVEEEQRPRQPEEIPQVQPKKENLYQDKFVFGGEERPTVKVEPVATLNDQISVKLPKLRYTYLSVGLGFEGRYDFYSKNSLGMVSKKENLTFDQVTASIDALGDDYYVITQAELALDT